MGSGAQAGTRRRLADRVRVKRTRAVATSRRDRRRCVGHDPKGLRHARHPTTAKAEARSGLWFRAPSAHNRSAARERIAAYERISVRQPWAWAFLHGKDIENRRWRTQYRGPILIHASMRVDIGAIPILIDRGLDVPIGLPTGGIVAKGELVDVVTKSASDWFSGPYGFVIRDVEPVEFVPMRGRLGLFDVDWMASGLARPQHAPECRT